MDSYFQAGASSSQNCKTHDVAWSEGFFNQFRENNIPPSETTLPPQQNFDTPEMQGSLQSILASTIGNYMMIEFLIGTEQMVRKQGILYRVGTSYITLYDDTARNFIICDLFSIKFVYIYYPGDRPKRYYNALPPVGNSR